MAGQPVRAGAANERGIDDGHLPTYVRPARALGSRPPAGAHQQVRENRYFVILGLGGGGALVGAAGEITKVSHTFQPSGRCSAPNSL